jgi:hypothetical protein
VEALIVTGAGRPTEWRFHVGSAAELRLIAGPLAAATSDTLVFRLAGRPGERVVFALQAGH